MSNLTESDFSIAETEIYCVHCNEKVAVGEKYIYYRGNYLCEDCAKNLLQKCDMCGKITVKSNMYKTEDTNKEICSDCAYRLPRCHDCSHIYEFENNMYTSDEGYHYCEKHKCNSFINSYGYKPTPHFYFGKNEIHNGNALAIGFELEVQNNNDYEDLPNWKVAEELNEKINKKYFGDKKFIYYKRDGSVEHGFEIISHPFTEQYFKENYNIFSEMLQILRDNNFVSHDSSYCGLHFHINRPFITKNGAEKENVDKLILFTEYYKDKIQAFSRRDDYHYCQFLSDAVSYLKRGTKAKNIKMIEKYKDYAGRYVVVNTQNRNTVEMRVFRGTLKKETFFATIEFVYNVANTVRELPVNKISWNKIVNNPKSKYIKEYCASRNIAPDRKYMRDLSLDYVKEINRQKRNLRKIQKEILVSLYDMYVGFIDNYKQLNKTQFNKILTAKEDKQTSVEKDIDLSSKIYIPEILSCIVESFHCKNDANDFYPLIAKILSIYGRHKKIFKALGERNHIAAIDENALKYKELYINIKSEM